MPQFPESTVTGESARIDAVAARLEEHEARLRAAEVASGDERTAKELRKAVEMVAKHDPRLEERVTNRVDVLADRLNTLATTVSTTANALAGKDGELVALRRELERENAKIEALASSRGTSSQPDLAALRRTVAELMTNRTEPASDKRVAQLSGKVDYLTERVDTLATTVAATAAGLAGREGDVTALRRRLDEDVAQLARTIGELKQPEVQDELAAQVRSLSAAVASSAHNLAQDKQETSALRALVDDGRARLDSAVAELRQALGVAAARIDGLEPSVGAAQRTLEREAAEAGARIEELSTRLDSIGTLVEATVAANEEREREIATLGRRFEQSSASVDSLVRDLSGAIAAMARGSDESLQIEEELAELEKRVGDLSDRLTSVTRERGDTTAELARTTALWSSELKSIEGRFEELGARLDSLDDPQGMPSERFASLVGEGRFRVESRALELRMEHAEAASRENREAVLTELERLAARIESRLQHLEREPELEPELSGDEHAMPMEAQVVSIRGTEA